MLEERSVTGYRASRARGIAGMAAPDTFSEGPTLERSGCDPIRRLNDQLGHRVRASETGVRLFVCECADPDCDVAIEAAIQHYEAVRTRPGHYPVAPGHSMAGPSEVIASNERFSVVLQTALAPAGAP